jgi:Ca2+-transporting ATPase
VEPESNVEPPAPEGAHARSAAEVAAALDVEPSRGLSGDEAARRLARWGPNRLEQAEGVHPLRTLGRQFTSAMVWVLLAAVVISLVIGETTDAAVIGAIVVMNAVLGFVQEFRAERAIEALRRTLALRAHVRRDGVVREVAADELVPGDVLLLETGDRVAADCRLLEAIELAAGEASLTGESVPVSKGIDAVAADAPVADRSDMVYAGTVVSRGRGGGIVCATGMGTEIGRVAQLVQSAQTEPTPLQSQLRGLSIGLGLAVLAVAVAVFVMGALVLEQPLGAILLTAIALAVAAIPEGLPAVVTIGLAIGVQRMARRHAFVRRLASVETLGECTVICSDKTGTLTHGEMTVRRLWVDDEEVEVTGSGYGSEGALSGGGPGAEQLLTAGALANNAELTRRPEGWHLRGDPTEAALLVSARKAGLDPASLARILPRIGELPFSSERKRMATIHRDGDRELVFVKGAPETVLPRCVAKRSGGRDVPLDDAGRAAVLERAEAFARQALRVLAFATRVHGPGEDPERDLVLLGLQAMIDPPRAEVAEALGRCRTAGIRVIMITGDHLATAGAIARELGIGGRAITGPELEEHPDLDALVGEVGVYARVDPAQELGIVRALQRRGEVVAMTGDGVNDAPALKQADLGVAMGGTGTDVAKEAGELVLADDNFATIVGAVEEGRRIYANIQKYLAYLLSGNIGEVAVIFFGILLGLPLPLLAIQLLWINLVTDGLPALALSADPAEPGVMQRPPRRPDESIFGGILPYITVYPLILTVGTLWLYHRALAVDVPTARTVAFTSIVIFELLQAVSCRSVTRPVLAVGLFANPWLWIAVAASLALQAALIYVPPFAATFKLAPLALGDWGMILAVASVGFVYLEAHKTWRWRRRRRPS